MIYVVARVAQSGIGRCALKRISELERSFTIILTPQIQVYGIHCRPMLSPAVTVIRAAFDIGSSSSKLQCCECILTPDKGSAGGYVCTTSKDIYSVERPVQFGADLMRSTDGSLSDDIQSRGLRIFFELKALAEALAEALGATQYSAVATEVFRRASSGNEYLDEIRFALVLIHLVSQSAEGELGYRSSQFRDN